jgi:hydrogenase assembly chaperone HypC/HupF
MCLATPLQLVKIENSFGFVEHGGNEYKIDLSLLDSPKVGDWILAHGEMAVSTLPQDEALKILELIKKSEAK